MRFFEPARRATLAALAEVAGARVLRGGELEIGDICSLDDPSDDAIGFVGSAKALAGASGLPAAVITTETLADRVPDETAVLLSPAPNVAFAAVGRHLYGAGERRPGQGVHPRAVVADNAKLEGDVAIAANAVVDAGVEIGEGTRIGPGAHIGEGCKIGRDCEIGANVVIRAALIGNRVRVRAGSVIGDPGFGYVPGPRGIDDVVQIGRVILQDDVHVGANACIDRGALGDTVISEGTKIGNLQQIAHNTRIGRHCIVVGNGGIAGSVEIGDGATLAGGVFTIDHASIGAGATVAGCTLVRGSVPAGETWGGIPARPIADYLRDVAEANARARKRRKAAAE